MNYIEYDCDFTINKNYILAYNINRRKIYKKFFNIWKQIMNIQYDQY